MTSFFSDHYSVSLLSHSEKGWEEKIAKEDGGLRSFSILNIPSILSQTELRLSLINHDWERSLLCASHHSICRLKRASQSSQWHVKTDQAWETLTWLVPTRLVIGQEISGSEVIGSLAWESGQRVRNNLYVSMYLFYRATTRQAASRPAQCSHLSRAGRHAVSPFMAWGGRSLLCDFFSMSHSND